MYHHLRCLLVLTGFALASMAQAQEMKPWALRDHLTFGGQGVTLDYDVEDGYWRVQRAANEIIADDLGWSVEFADGTMITPRDTGIAELARERFTHPDLGEGTYYTSVFPVFKGVRIKNRLGKFDNQPFLSFRISVENVSDAPVEIARVNAVSAGPGAIAPLSPGVQVRARHIVSRAGFPVYDAAAPPLGVQFHDPVKQTTFAMGVLPEQGRGEAAVDFQPYKDSWMGDIHFDYSPAVRIAPGAALDADPIGVSYGVAETGHVDLYYSWAFSAVARPESEAERPPSWVTVPESAGLSELINRGAAWKGYGLRHALIPAGWESVPGTQQGAAPRYPRSMSSAASDLSQAGLTPGITVDALAVANGKAGGAAQTSDGRWWANPAAPQGRDSIQTAAAALSRDGFAFLVVAPSMIPDVALKEFGLSRAEANNLGMNAIQQGAPQAAVLPASAGRIPLQRDAWLEAAACVGRMARFSANPGPVTLNTEGVSNLENETAVAISLWPGPIELLGEPKRGVMDTLGTVLHRSRVAGQPVDAGLSSPKQWHASENDRQTKGQISNMLLFNGAGTWDVADLDPGSAQPSGTRQAQDGPQVGAAWPRATAAASEQERPEKKRRRR